MWKWFYLEFLRQQSTDADGLCLPWYVLNLVFFKRENDDIPVRLHTALEQYCCPRNSDSYFVNIGYDWIAISFVDLHTAEFKSNIVLKRYAWPTYGFLDENAAYLFVANLWDVRVPAAAVESKAPLASA